MNKGTFFRIFLCIGFFGFCLYSYLDLQNQITELRIRIPQLTHEVRRIEEENTHLLYKIEAFESPEHLMALAKHAEFAHLKFPLFIDVLTLKQGDPLETSERKVVQEFRKKPTITFATGGTP